MNGGDAAEKWHAMASPDVLAALRSRANGLEPAEVATRLQAAGPNELPTPPKRAGWRVLLGQFRSPLIYLLLIAALIAAFLGERRDAAVIVAVVLINAVIGFIHEGRAERSMDALARLGGLRARVMRGGRHQEIPAVGVVPGDILVLSAGDAVAADARIIQANALEASEASLTGEPAAVAKSTAPEPADRRLGARNNMVYAGTHIVAGRGRAIVVATGSATEVGQIARMTGWAAQPPTPLEQRIAQLGQQLVTMVVITCVAVMGIGWWRGVPVQQLLMITLSQMVSLVPEGLPVAMTIALTVGMQRMARRGAIVRRLAAVETLGTTRVICTDKTGTLTRNEMTVTELWLPKEGVFTVSGIGYEPVGHISPSRRAASAPPAALASLLEAAALCNDAKLLPPDADDPRWRPLGDPTEAALLALARKGAIDVEVLRKQWPRRREIPFEPSAKMMATQHEGPDRQSRILIKGAPEAIVAMCARAGGTAAAFGVNEREQALAAARDMAERTLRVLAFAEIAGGSLADGASFDRLHGRAVFLGLAGQVDPPRTEAASAIATCQRAGIRTVMLTGDHQATGLAVARQLGMARAGHQAVDGHELEAMPEHELRARLDQIAVFARVLPAQKLRIVEAFQATGCPVAMTGDGVNDAPALARADVGVAMGITGTEVAKGAARIIITDDNFATIVHAVEEGRLVYANIQKLLLFLFVTSVDEVILLIGCLAAGLPPPLVAVQILWINLVTEGALTINLVMEGAEGNEMDRAPVRLQAGLVTREMIGRMVVMVSASVAATMGFYLWRLGTGAPLDLVRTETFTVLAVAQWFNALNCESAHRSALRFGVWRNKWLLAGLGLANLLHLGVVYLPALNRLFHTAPIPVSDFLLIGAVASVVLWAEELRKLFRSTYGRPWLCVL